MYCPQPPLDPAMSEAFVGWSQEAQSEALRYFRRSAENRRRGSVAVCRLGPGVGQGAERALRTDGRECGLVRTPRSPMLGPVPWSRLQGKVPLPPARRFTARGTETRPDRRKQPLPFLPSLAAFSGLPHLRQGNAGQPQPSRRRLCVLRLLKARPGRPSQACRPLSFSPGCLCLPHGFLRRRVAATSGVPGRSRVRAFRRLGVSPGTGPR